MLLNILWSFQCSLLHNNFQTFDTHIPLLQEYFFGDYGKIQLVIGKSFFEEPKSALKGFFADADYEDEELLRERKVFKIRNLKGKDFLDSVKSIYHGKNNQGNGASEASAGSSELQGKTF